METQIPSTYVPVENLTKENFWNELYSKYPKGMKVFCDWIDAYKKAVDWDKLFNDGYPAGYQGRDKEKHTESPKYHDLPFAMQIGIWIAFVQWLMLSDEYDISIKASPYLLARERWLYIIEETIKDLNRNDKKTKA